MIVKKVDSRVVMFHWKHRLWPGRYDLKTMSSMVYNNPDEYDLEIYEKYEPTFWAVYSDNGETVGVNSGFRTDETMYRSRGIWVSPDHRKQGIAQLLFKALEDQAISEGCDQIWSYPREGSHHAYLKFGFEMTSTWHNDSFGRNCYVLKQITSSK